MIPKIELLAPGGDVESIKAAIVAGADAVYCGLDRFNARNRAENISFDQLLGILRLAHSYNVQVFLTLNIIIVESEIPALVQLFEKLSNTSVDGIILQDLGMLYLAQKYFKRLKIHGSTQLTTHNPGQIKFLAQLGLDRVNLSRELNIQEIQSLTHEAHKQGLMVEVFVHGSNCLSFSGLCYISSVFDGKSGNRGRCGQPCRSQYLTTATGNDFPLNLKDNSAYGDLASLAEVGINSIKIEGRIKKFHYVYTVIKTWRKHLEQLYSKRKISADNAELYKVFNRGFSNGFLTGAIHRDMFIDNPRDNSALHLASTLEGEDNDKNLEQAKRQLYDQKTDIITNVRDKIDKLNIDKAPLSITLEGQKDSPLQLTLETPELQVTILSESCLTQGPVGENTVNLAGITKLLKNIKNTEYFIDNIDLDCLENNLLLPYRELTTLKKKIFTLINNGRRPIPAVILPRLIKQSGPPRQPTLSLLISSEKDLFLCEESEEVYYELPSSPGKDVAYFKELFAENSLIPWFPAVLIGEDYDSAVNLLEHVQPKKIITNNTGIAYEANRLGIDWVAGPYLNIVNSYSLMCLKETLSCSGAFISNELNNFQLKIIKAPENFQLYYSIYHPIILMTSRQCLFHQVTGCEKSILDSSCLNNCQRRSTLSTMDNESIIIEKTKGNYHSLYNNHNFLNTEIIEDKRNIFNSFFIDLRDIETETTVAIEKRETVRLFQSLIRGNKLSGEELKKHIHPTTVKQYLKGI